MSDLKVWTRGEIVGTLAFLETRNSDAWGAKVYQLIEMIKGIETLLTRAETAERENERLTNFLKQAMGVANRFYVEYMAQVGSTAVDGKFSLPRELWMALDKLIQEANDLSDKKGGAG